MAPRPRTITAILLALGFICLEATFAVAASQHRDAVYETNVSKDSVYGGGEPEIAVNPSNPRNLVEIWLASAELYKLQSPPAEKIADPGALLAECHLAFSTDRGGTWHRVAFHITDTIRSTCADPVVASDTNGRFYAGGDCFNPAGLVTGVGGVCVTRSSDGGRTWGPTTLIAAFPHGTSAYAEPREGLPGPISPWDRPWMAVDSSTHTLYVEAIDHMDPTTAAPARPSEGGFGRWYVGASHDGGRTFSPMHPFDSDAYPSGGGGWMSAAHGTLAAAYMISNLPTAPDYSRCDAGCHFVFEASTDEGRSWKRHVLPVVKTFSQGTSDQLYEWLGADPTHPGRYAVMLMAASGTRLEIYLTRDAGRTWRHTASVGEDSNQRFKPWLAYGPTGVLGVFWRTMYADGTYDAWAAVSRNGGLSFDAPLRISLQPSPAYQPQYAAGDDFSFAALDRHYLHAAWGDSRSGMLNAWYGRVHIRG
jgi:hypothetical protein